AEGPAPARLPLLHADRCRRRGGLVPPHPRRAGPLGAVAVVPAAHNRLDPLPPRHETSHSSNSRDHAPEERKHRACFMRMTYLREGTVAPLFPIQAALALAPSRRGSEASTGSGAASCAVARAILAQ